MVRAAIHTWLATASGNRGSEGGINPLSDALKFLFSWVALMPIAVIVSGKFLAHIPSFRLYGQDEQHFGLHFPVVINFFAKGDEVVFGFGLFIAEFFVLAMTSGQGIYTLFKSNFGADLGQFNSICVFSAFLEVILSGCILVLVGLFDVIRTRADPVRSEYDITMKRLTRGRRSNRGSNE